MAAEAQIPNAAQGFRLPLTALAHGEWGDKAPVASFAGQLAQESMFNCKAVSRTGAKGCAQVMPATGNWLAKLFPSELGRNDPGNPMWDLRAMVMYDHWLFKRVKGDSFCEQFGFALQSYNSGLLWVQRRQKQSNTPGICFSGACNINPGVLPSNQKEAQEYPVRIEQKWAPRFSEWGSSACGFK